MRGLRAYTNCTTRSLKFKAAVVIAALLVALTSAQAGPEKKKTVPAKSLLGTEDALHAADTITKFTTTDDALRRENAALANKTDAQSVARRQDNENQLATHDAAVDGFNAQFKDPHVQIASSQHALTSGDATKAFSRANQAVAEANASGDRSLMADALKTRALAAAGRGDIGRAHADAADALKLDPSDVLAADIEKLTRDKNLPSRVRLLDNGREQTLPPLMASLVGRLRAESVVTRPAGFSSSVAATKRADTAVQLGDWDAMYAKADAALKQLPDNPRAYMQRAFASLMLKKYERAIADATAGLKLQPKSASLYGVRAAAYNGSGQPAKALADAQKAVENDPKDPVGWLQRGLAREKLGAPEDQWVADIKQAAELDPDNFADQYREALARRGQGQPEGAGAPGAVGASGEGGGLLAGFLAPINRKLQSMPKADAERLVLRAAWSLVGCLWVLVLFLLGRALKRRRTSIRRAADEM